jgi:hypothetical protein
MAVYRAKAWKLKKIDHKYFEISEMWYWRRMEKIFWTDRGKKEVMSRVKEEMNIVHTIKR